MHCLGIAVLGVLDKKDHQKSDDGSTGIDDELPGIGKVKCWPSQRPDHDDDDRTDERPGRAEDLRGLSSEDMKGVTYLAKEVCSLDFLMGIAGRNHLSNDFGRPAFLARIVDFPTHWGNN